MARQARGAAPARPAASPTGDAPERCGAGGLAAVPPHPDRPAAGAAGSRDAGRRPGRHDVETPRSGPAAASRPCGAAPGSKVSLGQLLEHVDVQCLVGDQPLEPGVFGFQLLEPLGLAGLHPAVPAAPAVPGRLGDLQGPQDLGEILAVVEEPLALADLADRLLRGVPVSLHRDRPPAHSLGSGLSQQVDQLQGLTSRAELNERSGRWRASMTRNPTAAGSSCSARRASVTREAYLEDAIGAYILYQQES